MWSDPDRGTARSWLLAQIHGKAVDVLRSENARRAREERDARKTGTVTDDLEREVMDLAELLEQPEGTVKSRIRSGLLRLRAALIEAGVHE